MVFEDSCFLEGVGPRFNTTLPVKSPPNMNYTDILTTTFPSLLHSASGIIPTMDVWAGSLAAILYGIATFSNPSYSSINTYLVGKPAPFMTPLGARSLVVVFLTFMYTIRVVSTHFVPKGNPVAVRISSVGTATPSSKRAIKPMPVGKEKKVQ